jgi:hypothetical protein
MPLLLAAVVLVQQLVLASKLGFYSDDWEFLWLFRTASGRSPYDFFQTVYNAQPWTRVRPVQLWYLSLSYSAFGQSPLGYHAVNLAFFAAAVVVLYLALSRLGLPDKVCASIPLVYSVLPHYSADRFWIAAAQANIAMSGLFLNLYAGLRALSGGSSSSRMLWTLLSVGALLLSGLAYEVSLPLFLINAAVFWNRSRPTGGRGLLISTALSFTAVIVFKLTSDRARLYTPLPIHLTNLLIYSTKVNLIGHVLFLPVMLWQIATRYPTVLGFGTALVVVGITSAGILRQNSGEAQLSSKAWQRLLLLGAIIYVLGYAVFFTNEQVGYSLTGPLNRTAIAAALGLAMMIVAGAGMLPRGKHFVAVISTVCFCGVLLNTTLGCMWCAAANRQQQVLAAIHRQLPALPSNTTILVAGVCPYIGPGIVFESSLDLGSALRLLYGDPTLGGNVVSPDLKADSDGLYRDMYGERYRHSYSQNLIAFDYESGRVSHLVDEGSSRKYLLDATRRHVCPQSELGKGEQVFAR